MCPQVLPDAMSMAEDSNLVGNLIFLSYRRVDSATYTLALRLELETRLRAVQVFVDTHTIQGGDVWPHQIEDAVHLAKVVVPIIGKSWAAGDRIEDPEDWVHKELKLALTQKRGAILPVLVDGASPLRQKQLPDPLRGLADIQPLKIDVDSWDGDVSSFVEALKERFGFETKARIFKYPPPDPLKAKTIPVSWDVLEKEVAKTLGDWRIEFSDDPDRLHYKRVELVRNFEFESFEKAISFMDVAAKHASEIDHHPRWMNLWRTVTVWLSTWDAGHRVTILDVQLALYLERKYRDMSRAKARGR
jgi:pterin-4a-carbinolamine dehydratase